MNRVIKFRAWNGKRMLFMGAGGFCDFELRGGSIFEFDSCGFDSSIKDYPLMQYTGLKDKNGVEIFERDLLNIYYTSSDGEYIHDCIYEAVIGAMGLEFRFKGLLWESYGHNQYPSSTTLSEYYDSLKYGYFDENNTNVLMVPDSYGENHLLRNKWKQNDKSMWFEVIGNLHQNPELIGL